VLKDVFSIRTPGLPPATLKEFEYLLQRTEWEAVRDTLIAEADFISPEIMRNLLHTVTNSPRSGRVLHRLRRAVRHELSAWQRHSRWWAVRTYFAVLLRRKLRFQGSGSSGKVPAAGGQVIAVIGADGSGKSTVSHELCRWLSCQLRTCYYYMGSQQPSRVTRGIHLGYRIAGKLHVTCIRCPRQSRAIGRLLYWLRSLLHHLYNLAVGWDRLGRYRAGRRKAAQGAVVICDRYPLAAIHRVMESRPMDGPQIAATVGNRMDRIARLLSRLEQDMYHAMRPPDWIVALHVSPEVALQRKPDHDLGVIEAKTHAIERMERRGLRMIDIDANQPVEQALLQVKTAVWQIL
jgi:thymidylate kinase